MYINSTRTFTTQVMALANSRGNAPSGDLWIVLETQLFVQMWESPMLYLNAMQRVPRLCAVAEGQLCAHWGKASLDGWVWICVSWDLQIHPEAHGGKHDGFCNLCSIGDCTLHFEYLVLVHWYICLQVATPMDYFQFHSDADNEEVGHQIALPEVDHKCLVLPTDCGQLYCPGGEHA